MSATTLARFHVALCLLALIAGTGTASLLAQTRDPRDVRPQTTDPPTVMTVHLDDPGAITCADWVAKRQDVPNAVVKIDDVMPWLRGYFAGAFDLGFHLAVSKLVDPLARTTLSAGLDTVAKIPDPRAMADRIDKYCELQPETATIREMAISLLKAGYPKPPERR